MLHDQISNIIFNNVHKGNENQLYKSLKACKTLPEHYPSSKIETLIISVVWIEIIMVKLKAWAQQ